MLYLKVMILAEIVEEISGPGIWLQMFVWISLSQLKTLLFQDYMITTPEPFVFYIMHHVMIMVSIIKGADSRTFQNISTYKEIDCGYVLQIAGHISLL